MPYKYLENLAIADVAFEATGKTLKELFESAALAVLNTQVKDVKTVKPEKLKNLELEAENLEMLLYKFLQEIIFLKDAELLLLSKFEIKIFPENGRWRLKAKARGEKIAPKRHELLVDVKAVSLHQFKVEEIKTGWKTFVILDV